MKIVSFNINGIRARPTQLAALIEKHQPDIIGLQETKVVDNEFPLGMIENLGYQAFYHGQKAHYGVALLSKVAPQRLQKGFPNESPNAQRRFIHGQWKLADGRLLHVMNGYFPQGESRDHPEKFPAKRQFYADLLVYLQGYCSPDDALLLLGDMNIAPLDSDIGIGAENAKRWLRTGKCSFLPEERAWLAALCEWGLIDTFRHFHPDSRDEYSWFDYRSRGFERQPRTGLRIDLILASRALINTCQAVGIDYALRALEKPSDHCPIWVELAQSPIT